MIWFEMSWYLSKLARLTKEKGEIFMSTKLVQICHKLSGVRGVILWQDGV